MSSAATDATSARAARAGLESAADMTSQSIFLKRRYRCRCAPTLERRNAMNTPKRLAVSMSLALLGAGCANLAPETPAVSVPEKLRPVPSDALALVVPARGFQVYECSARGDRSDAYAWRFVSPEAELFDARGNRIGR